MARNENLPFEIGATYFAGQTPDTTVGIQLEGKVYEVEELDYSAGGGTKPQLSGRYKKVMVVRNLAGSAVLPKLIAKMKTDGSGYEYLGQVMGYAGTVGEKGYPIDEFLPAAGAPANDLFYVVIEGMAKVTTAATGDTNISIGSFVIPTTGGVVIDQDTTVAAGAATFAQIQGAIGRAVTAVNAISTDFYINVAGR